MILATVPPEVATASPEASSVKPEVVTTEEESGKNTTQTVRETHQYSVFEMINSYRID